MNITMNIKAICKACGIVETVPHVLQKDWQHYIAGNAFVQDIWPDMSPASRKVLIANRTGYFVCTNCENSPFFKVGHHNE